MMSTRGVWGQARLQRNAGSDDEGIAWLDLFRRILDIGWGNPFARCQAGHAALSGNVGEDTARDDGAVIGNVQLKGTIFHRDDVFVIEAVERLAVIASMGKGVDVGVDYPMGPYR
jgi:hypothetical protein